MWFNLLVVIMLVALSGTFAGLTLALFSIKLTTLERKVRLGDKKALKVYKIRKKGNLLLCSLLLGNVASYTVMAIFLGSITSGVIAGFIATGLIFVFGEIIPQAVFPRYAIAISAQLTGMIWVVIYLLYPVAAPIAWVLDKVLGKEPPVLWSKAELREIISYHKDVGDGIIDQDEERIVMGALSFSELKVKDCMIPYDQVFYLEDQTEIDRPLLSIIREKGFGRIPVINAKSRKVCGILYSKDLIGFKETGRYTISNLSRDKNLIRVMENMHLDKLLNLLIRCKMHMAIVLDDNEFLKGIVTLEDIMEEILKTELEDQKN